MNDNRTDVQYLLELAEHLAVSRMNFPRLRGIIVRLAEEHPTWRTGWRGEKEEIR